MKEGENVRIIVNGEEKFGKVVKIYTQIGYQYHGQEVAVINLHDSHLKFYETEIEMVNGEKKEGL